MLLQLIISLIVLYSMNRMIRSAVVRSTQGEIVSIAFEVLNDVMNQHYQMKKEHYIPIYHVFEWNERVLAKPTESAS